MNPVAGSAAYPQRAEEDRDDSGLFRRMAGGDEAALGELYDRWEPRVRAIAVGLVGDAMEADDVVEEVFWQAWRQASRFDASRGNAGSLLLTVARSRSLDRLRASRRTRDAVQLDVSDRAAPDEALIGDANPLRDAEEQDLARLVRAELAELPSEQRGVIELAYFEGLSQTEIADRTGEPLGTVKTRMRLALRKLRDRFSALEEYL